MPYNIPGRVRDLELTMRQTGLSFANLNITCVAAANDLVLTVKTDADANPSPGDPGFARFKSRTQASGLTVVKEIISTLTLTIPAAASLGSGNGEQIDIYPNLCLGSTGVELGATLEPTWTSGFTSATTAISGAATSRSAMYTTTSMVGGVSVIVLGRITITRGTNQWSNQPTTVFSTATPLVVRQFGPTPQSIPLRNQAGEVLTSHMHRMGGTSAADFTFSLLTRSGAAPSVESPVVLPFRSNTQNVFGFNYVSFTAATTILLVGGATLGMANGQEGYVYVWVAYNGTQKEIALSRVWKDITKLHSTTAISTSADSSEVIYTSATSMSNAALYPLGRMVMEYTTNDWSAVPALTPRNEEYIPDWKKTRDILQHSHCFATAATTWIVDVSDPTTYTWQEIIAILPASLTGSMGIPIQGLEEGDHITGFWLNGRVESGGNTVTVGDVLLVRVTYAAGSATQTTIKTFTSFNVSTDTLLSISNTLCFLDAPERVDQGDRFFLLVNGVTNASCEIRISNAVVRVN